MITRNDCILLLSELESRGIDVGKHLNNILSTSIPSMDTIKFIYDNKPLEICDFYKKIRKSYNQKKSKLYKNLVSEEQKNSNDVLTTLAALNLQIILYMNNVTDKQLFIKHSRLGEISESILNYSKTYDLIPCIQLLALIKADLKLCEEIIKN